MSPWVNVDVRIEIFWLVLGRRI